MRKSSIVALGALGALGAVALAASGKKEEKSSSVAETWHLVFAIHPDIPSVDEFNKITDTISYAVVSAGGNVQDITTEPNTIDMVIRFPGKAIGLPKVGSSETIGPYTIMLTEKDKVS